MYATNHIPYIDTSESLTNCCTLIQPSLWDGQTFTFDNKLFAKVSTRSFLHIPLNMTSVMQQAQDLIHKAGAEADEFIILSYEASPWRADHYFAVNKPVPGVATKKLSGTYMTKVFEGSYSNVQKWYAQLIGYAKSRGKKPLKTYFFYTTCPKCAKTYGKNYVVGFAQVE